MAASKAELPSIVSQVIEAGEAKAFMICMRIACVEQLLDQSHQQVREWELSAATDSLKPEAIGEWVRKSAGKLCHRLVRLPSGRTRCAECGLTHSGIAAGRWLSDPCNGGDQAYNDREHLKKRATKVFQGTFKEFLREQAKHNRKHTQAAAANSRLYSTSVSKLLRGLAGAPDQSDEAGELPAWASEIASTHQFLIHGGGFVCCIRCGALAASHHRRSGLFSECPAAGAHSWVLPEGSKWRLARFKGGWHPEGKAAQRWPDGRPAATQLKPRLARVPELAQEDQELEAAEAEI